MTKTYSQVMETIIDVIQKGYEGGAGAPIPRLEALIDLTEPNSHLRLLIETVIDHFSD